MFVIGFLFFSISSSDSSLVDSSSELDSNLSVLFSTTGAVCWGRNRLTKGFFVSFVVFDRLSPRPRVAGVSLGEENLVDVLAVVGLTC